MINYLYHSHFAVSTVVRSPSLHGTDSQNWFLKGRCNLLAHVTKMSRSSSGIAGSSNQGFSCCFLSISLPSGWAPPLGWQDGHQQLLAH